MKPIIKEFGPRDPHDGVKEIRDGAPVQIYAVCTGIQVSGPDESGHYERDSANADSFACASGFFVFPLLTCGAWCLFLFREVEKGILFV